ncbi:MAG: enoyl-CoA hydratase-related protein [Pseudomonadales bacterium]
MSDFTSLDLSVVDGVATITLNRPEAANSIDVTMSAELLKASLAVASDPQVRVLILTGAGRLFSAGGDLAFMATLGDKIGEGLREVTANLHSALATLSHMNAPVITAINGTAAGAGFSLAITGDFVIASDRAKFTMAYTAAGLAPDGSSTYYLPRLVGIRRAKELMITNRLLNAAEALEWGLINEVVPADELMTRANALAAQLATGATCAFGEVKRMLHASFQNGLETQMQMETNAIANMSRTADGQEGVAAFLGKRKPEFKGC